MHDGHVHVCVGTRLGVPGGVLIIVYGPHGSSSVSIVRLQTKGHGVHSSWLIYISICVGSKNNCFYEIKSRMNLGSNSYYFLTLYVFFQVLKLNIYILDITVH
jgi:hypothetical protein